MAQIGLANIAVVLRSSGTAAPGEDDDPPGSDEHTVTGWSDDADALTMPDEFELMNTRYGAGGQLAAFRTGMVGGDVTIKLLPTSPSVVYFMQRVEFALLPGSRLIWSGYVEDRVNNFKFLLRNGVMAAAPLGVTIGSGDAANRMFRFSFEAIVPEWENARFA